MSIAGKELRGPAGRTVRGPKAGVARCIERGINQTIRHSTLPTTEAVRLQAKSRPSMTETW
jgi:hypothetical protein